MTAAAGNPAGGHVSRDVQPPTDWPQAQGQSGSAPCRSPFRPALTTTLALDQRDTSKLGWVDSRGLGVGEGNSIP